MKFDFFRYSVHVTSIFQQSTYHISPFIHFTTDELEHHLHQILLYSLQHQLPTRSVLHHDDHSHLPHTVELYCTGKERRNKSITDAHKKGEQFESEYEEEN